MASTADLSEPTTTTSRRVSSGLSARRLTASRGALVDEEIDVGVRLHERLRFERLRFVDDGEKCSKLDVCSNVTTLEVQKCFDEH